MRTRLVAIAAGAVMAMTVGGPALAHDDSSSDPSYETRCDTWYRSTHESGDGSHDHTSGNDTSAGPVYVHNHSGHYVVRGSNWYIEVVGGSYYHDADGNGSNDEFLQGQGGYAQAEYDAGGGNDVDANASVFATGKAGACVSALNNKVGEQGKDPQHGGPKDGPSEGIPTLYNL